MTKTGLNLKERRINSRAGVTLVIARFLNENLVIRICFSQNSIFNLQY